MFGTLMAEKPGGPSIRATSSLSALFGEHRGVEGVGRGMCCPHRGQDHVLFSSEPMPTRVSRKGSSALP